MKKITLSLTLAFLPFCALAEIFQTTITVDGKGETQTESFNFDVGNDLFNQFKSQVLEKSFSNYSDKNATATAVSSFRGLIFNSGFFEAKSTLLTFDIPVLGVHKTFEEATRTKSATALENYLRKDTDGVLSQITRELIATSPTEPLAGNPSSLQGQMVASDFNVGSGNSLSASTRQPLSNPFVVGVGGGTFRQGSTDISVINVPISKAFGVDSDDPRKKLVVNGQFNYVTVGEASSYQGGLGIGYRHPLSDNWYLTPSVSYGVIGSADLISLGQIFSTSLTSDYQFNVADYTLSVANMFGFYKTLPLNVSQINSDPDISNYVLKNGFFVGKVLPFKLFDHSLNLKGFFTDTEFFGSRVFIRQYNEIGFQINTLEKVKWLDTITFGMADALSFSGKYIFSIENSNSLEGYDIALSYDF